MDLGLDGSVYLVSGGTRGLGRATAEVLIDEGACVVVSGRDAAVVHTAAAELHPERALGIAADNADPAAPERLVASAMARFGRIDGALISVGGPPGGGIDDLTDDQWRFAFDTVFLGAVRMARAVARALPVGGGSIVFVLSSSVHEPIRGLAASNGLRPGLAMVAKSMADEWGSAGIRVNGLLPGRIATDRLVALDKSVRKGDASALKAAVPLRRDGAPAEFGRVAAFVLSPAASYLTGTMIPVDGGTYRGL